MSAWFIGFLMVVVSAAAFGFVLFGRRPLPQTATALPVGTAAGVGIHMGTETVPRQRRRAASTTVPDQAEDGTGTLLVPPAAAQLRSRDVRAPLGVRMRSLVVLLIGTLGTAVLIGTVASIVIVGALLVVS